MKPGLLKNQYLIQVDLPCPETTYRGCRLTLHEDKLQGCEGGSLMAKVLNAAAATGTPCGLKPTHGIH